MQSVVRLVPKTKQIDAETARIVRKILEQAACRLERYAVCGSYKYAMRKAAAVVRELKPD